MPNNGGKRLRKRILMTQPRCTDAPVVSPTTGELLPGNLVSSRVDHPFGHAVSSAGQREWDFKKELQNKLAWVVGTSYGVPYSKRREAAQEYASRMVTALVRDHGYPNTI